ncbi:MAG TPA: SurA N-terminal domain-containing protein [Candidatus Binatia bacterium]|jgi:peptidyl-prolyl cis-trans isomerase D
MLDFMRRNARSWGIRAALGLITLVFIFFMGGGGRLGKGLTPLVKVGDIEITRTDFDISQRRNENYFREQFKGQVSDAMMKSLNIPKMTLDQLVDGAVLRAEADRLGLKVTEDAIRDQLVHVPAFQGRTGFSPDLYRETVRSQGMTPGSFEDGVRRELLETQMADIIRRGAHVSEEDAWQEFQRQNRKINLSYVTIDSEPFEKDVKIDEEALTKFYDSRQESYRRPPTVKVRYVAYKVADIADKIDVSDVDMNEYYDLNKNSEFQQEEQVSARHILKKVDKDASDDQKKAAREAIDAIAKKLADGGNFEEIAKTESDDPGSAAKGGDLGTFGRGHMVPAFEDAAFALEPGQTSGVVETDFGFHIIQVYAKQPAGVQPFDQVKDKIRKSLATQKALDRAFDDSAEDAAKISGGAKFDDIAGTRGAKIEETPPFTQGDVVAGIGPAPAFVEAAFSLLNPGDISDPVKVGQDYYLLSLVERKESYVPALADIRDQVESEFKSQKALDLAREKADDILQKAKAGTALVQLAQQNALELKSAADVDGSANFVQDIGAVPGLSEVAFAATRDGEPLSRSFVSGSKAYVFVRDSVIEAKREDFDAGKKQQVESLEKARQQDALQEFIRSLKEKEKISYDVAQLRPLLGDKSSTLTE